MSNDNDKDKKNEEEQTPKYSERDEAWATKLLSEMKSEKDDDDLWDRLVEADRTGLSHHEVLLPKTSIGDIRDQAANADWNTKERQQNQGKLSAEEIEQRIKELELHIQIEDLGPIEERAQFELLEPLDDDD
jgi:hypothetical protein